MKDQCPICGNIMISDKHHNTTFHFKCKICWWSGWSVYTKDEIEELNKVY